MFLRSQRPFWPLEASHVAMEGHPHVRPGLLVPPTVHPLTSSFPSHSVPSPRSNSFPPPSTFQSSDLSAYTPLSSDPLPPPHPLSSAAAITAPISLPLNLATSISAPSSATTAPIPSSSHQSSDLRSSLSLQSLSSTVPIPDPSPTLPNSSSPANLLTATATAPLFCSADPKAFSSSAAGVSPSSFSSSSPINLSSVPLISIPPSTGNLPSPSLQASPFVSFSSAASSAQAAGPAPPRQSYAQVTRSSRGPGFIRGHAIEVEAFARIPRTGSHVICGTREGMPSFSFVNADLPKIEELYSNALVMRFLGGRPSLEASHKEIVEWGVSHPFSIGPLSSRAFLLRFQNDGVLLKVLTRPSTLIKNFPYKIFRWHNQCHRQADSCLVPVWISLPRLPLQCFIPEFLEAVANKIGKFLCFDKATTTLARPSAARLCVEIDLRKAPPQSIWVGLFEGFKQPIIYERLPKFCMGCCMIGHATTECSKYVAEPRQHAVADRIPIRTKRTPSVRQNVKVGSSSVQQQRPLIERPLALQKLGPHPTQSPHISTSSEQPINLQSSNPPPPPPPLPHNLASSQELLSTSQPTHPTNPLSTSVPLPSTGLHLKSVAFAPVTSHTSSSLPLPSLGTISASSSLSFPVQGANTAFWEAINNRMAVIEKDPNTVLIPTAVTRNLADEPSVKASSLASEIHEGVLATIASHNESLIPPEAQEPDDASKLNDIATYDSEGEDPLVEASTLEGHCTDDPPPPPTSSKRNKRHPDGPLKVTLRVRKDPPPPSQ